MPSAASVASAIAPPPLLSPSVFPPLLLPPPALELEASVEAEPLVLAPASPPAVPVLPLADPVLPASPLLPL